MTLRVERKIGRMNEIALFNQATFLELISELGQDDAAEVLRVFLADTSGKMSAIASDLGQRSIIRREAHLIKSSAATFGFVELSTLARQLEADVPAMSPVELRQSVSTLRQAFERTESFARANLLTSSLGISSAHEAAY